MISCEKIKKDYYTALLSKDNTFEGVFFVGVKTTGVFCRPTCPARKPKFENCEFYKTAQEALLASFRPCLRCRPLSHPNYVSETVTLLVNAVEENPTKRWKTHHFKELSIDESTARRQFKKHFDMTFVEYARARRIGIAIKYIRSGESVIDAQLLSGYESGSGFRDAFSKIMGSAPKNTNDHKTVLKATWLDTILGSMPAIADETGLYLLEFVDRRGLKLEIKRLLLKTKAAILPGTTNPITSIDRELKEYFDGKRMHFETPFHLLGSPFQKDVWHELIRILYGETRSYSDQAKSLNKLSAFKTVANANGANQLAIIIPCHRIISSEGTLGGYGGGIELKRWLIEHETAHKK